MHEPCFKTPSLLQRRTTIHFKMKCLLILVTILSVTLALPGPQVKVPAPTEDRRYVVACSHLPNADLKSVGGGPVNPLDVSDPFLVVRDSGGTQIFRSETVDNNNSPIYQWTVNWSADQVYTFELRDHDAFAPDDPLGQISIPAQNLERLEGWNLANPAGGTIRFLKL